MPTPTVYVLCDCHNRYEGMTKEQILAAIVQAVETHEIADVDTGFVTTIKEQNANAGFKVWIGTQAQYNAIATVDTDTLYLISDDDTLDSLTAAIENIINGSTPVAEATHASSADSATNATNAAQATSADSATNATNATNATKVGDNTIEDTNGVLTVKMSSTSTVTDSILRRHNIFNSTAGTDLTDNATVTCSEAVNTGDVLEIYFNEGNLSQRNMRLRALVGTGYASIGGVLGAAFIGAHSNSPTGGIANDKISFTFSCTTATFINAYTPSLTTGIKLYSIDKIIG